MTTKPSPTKRSPLPLQPGDAILGPLNAAQVAAHAELDEMCGQLHALATRARKLQELYDAKRTVYWAELETAHERAETALTRGKGLFVRRGDGAQLLLVEAEPPKENGGGLEGLLRELGAI